jgi:hypothetical protein
MQEKLEKNMQKDLPLFDRKEMGVRALARDLTTKIKTHKGDIRKIISEYAPDNENDTEAYINFVTSHIR